VFGEIKALVDVVRDSASGLGSIRGKRARSNAILELLRIYFALSDVVVDGRTLLQAVGEDPRKTLAKVPRPDRPRTVIEWDNFINRQATRLYNLSGRLLGQDALAVLDPGLKERLQELIGSKFARVETLEGIGAGLVIYSMFFSGKDDWKMRRNIIVSMYPARTTATIDVASAKRELKKLEVALEEYRTVCLKLCSEDEILRLSKKAREQTLLHRKHH
jgi:hypothetical protein